MPTLLFDIDGTLVRTGGAGKAAMEAALRTAFGVPDINDVVPYSGRTDVAIGRDLLAAHDIPATADNQEMLVETYLLLLPDCLHGYPGEVCPGVPQLLRKLAGVPGTRIGLLTGNIKRGAEIKLAHFGLWKHFAFGGFGDAAHDRDDVARAAVAAAEKHGGGAIDPGGIWVIGDTPLDVKCGRAIGANTIAVATGWHPVTELAACEPDAVLENLADPATWPAAWFA